ncbi:MAG TPA: M15 family metallopeptidase, partial [Myxococcota bacterium]
VLVVLLLAFAATPPAAPAFPVDQDVILPGLTDVGAKLPSVHVELKYGTTDNFMHKDAYGGLKRCFLVDDAAKMLGDALGYLHKADADLSFVTYDCARPKRVQEIMWSVVEGTSQQGYVANPNVPPGSVHNTGCAVDISLWDMKKNAPVDMGTPFDFFGTAAEPRHEVELLVQKKLTYEQYANRLLLREVMLRAGFHLLAHEWWHFDCMDGFAARRKYGVIP